MQKVPALLDEVHWLHEHRKIRFALCGSSARKVRRGAANLLGGRAVRYELHGLTAAEIGKDVDLVRLLNHGYLPTHYESDRPERLLASYVGDYLKEEVAAEGLVRNLPVFSAFLNAAALSDGDLVNFANIARDCGVSGHTVKGHFGILEDTLLGRWLPAYTKRPKRRVVAAPKFYFSDVGVVNHLARRGRMQPGGELFGKAFENWVLPRAARVQRVSRDVRRAVLLAARQRHRSGLHRRPDGRGDRSQGQRADHSRPSQGTAPPARRSPAGPTRRRVPGTQAPHDRGRHRDPAGVRLHGGTGSSDGRAKVIARRASTAHLRRVFL